MRDLADAARRHRARFVLARRAVPPVSRVLLAGRSATVVNAGARTRLSVQVNPTLTVTGAVRVLAGAPRPPVAGGVEPLAPVVATAISGALARATGRTDAQDATQRLDRVLTSTDHHVTRTEQRIPQVTRVVTHTLTTGAASRGAEAAAAQRPSAPQAPAAITSTDQPAVLDLGRITDYVLTAMDNRLSAYAERLGRG